MVGGGEFYEKSMFIVLFLKEAEVCEKSRSLVTVKVPFSRISVLILKNFSLFSQRDIPHAFSSGLATGLKGEF